MSVVDSSKSTSASGGVIAASSGPMANSNGIKTTTLLAANPSPKQLKTLHLILDEFRKS